MSTRHATIGSDGGSSARGSSTSGPTRDNGKLPLPDDYFRTPKLNTKETKYLVNLAKRACKEVVFYSRRTGGPINWVHLSSDDGVQVFQGMDEHATGDASSVTYLRGATRIYATIDEIAEFFRLDTPMKLSGFTQTVGKDLLDQKTLYDLAMPTAENPKHYVGVKWTAVESPSKLARNRDFCYLECHDEFIDTNSKKRGWVRSLHSIRLPFCPDLLKSHGLVRGSLYRSGFVFIESDDKSYVDAVHTLHMDIKGNAPNWLKIMVMKRRIKNIAEVNRYFQMRRLCEGRLLSDLELPNKSGVLKCQICSHRFGLFSRKTACRKCGKIVCTPCGHPFILDYAGLGAKKVRICTHCADRVVHGGDGLASQVTSHIGAHALESLPRPLYDQSPSSRGVRSRSRVSRQRSAEEREYYANNEDASGMADIEEAKRMHREFEEHCSRSALAQPKNAQPTVPATALPKHQGPSRGRRQSERFVGFDEPAESRRKTTVERVSAYQEFLKNERARQKSIGAPVVTAMRGAPNRKSLIHTAGAPAPGELLSRTRQKQSQGQGRFSSNSTELEFQLPSPQDQFESIRISSEYEPDYEYPLSKLHKLQRLHDNASILSDDTVGAPIRRSDLSIGRSSRTSISEAFHPSAVDRDMLPDDVAHRGPVPVLPPVYASSTSTDSFAHNGPLLANNQFPSQSVGPPPQLDSRGQEFQHFRQSYFDARNSGIDELQERVDSHPPSTDGEGDFRYGYDVVSGASDYTDKGEYEVPASAESIARFSQRNPVTEKPEASKRDTVTELATVMALSAMQLYEKENGLDHQVSEETRQAALKKMVEIYSSEIERSADEHRLGSQRTKRSASIAAPSSDSARGNQSEDQSRSYRLDRQHAQTMMAYGPNSAEYRDLSDLSASAFKAYQKGSRNDTTPSPQTDAEPSLPSNANAASRRQPVGSESKSSSSANAPSTTHRGSIPNSEGLIKPPSPVRDDVSDTFSELDLIDLPHLMRAEDTMTNERSSVDRLSHESHQTTFSELSSRLSSSSHTVPRLSELSASGAPGGSSYASLNAEPGLRSPPSSAAQTKESISDDGDVTSRTKMTQSELERYRASLAELMAEYDLENSVDTLVTIRQPEREDEPDTRSSFKQTAANGRPRVRQELYL